MNHGNFTLLYSKMLGSSIWMEPSSTRIVWFTLMMLKDKDGFVAGGSVEALAHQARVTPEECRVALETFLSPDPESTSANDEGRRLRKVDGGWVMINHEQYRYSTEAKREFWRQQKAEQRRKEEEARQKKLAAREKKNAGKPLNGEVENVKKLADGEITEAQFAERAATSREH